MINFVIELDTDKSGEIAVAALVCPLPGCGWQRNWSSDDRDVPLAQLVDQSSEHESDAHGRS